MAMELVRGTRDFSPSEAISLKETISVIEEIFKRFGFYPLMTPSMEAMDTLNSKAYGQQSRNEIYALDDGKTGMRYDLSVPLARYVSMNKDITMPFKRYQIEKVWRRDEPQKMRAREFIQADIDIVGSTDPISDAETMAAAALAIEALGIDDYVILLNSRIFINAILDKYKVPRDKQMAAIVAIDKLAKTTRKEVIDQLSAIGIDQRISESMLNFMKDEMDNEQKLQRLATETDGVKAEVGRMLELLKTVGSYGLRGEITIDFSLARGLNYYTGAIWEFVAFRDGRQMPTIVAGGRYDGLIGLYTKAAIPAVGTSIGVNRIFELLQNGKSAQTYAKIFVAYIGKDNAGYAIGIANMLRGRGLYADLNAKERNISKQLEYANSLRIRYAVIVGNAEREQNKVKLRDMINGSEQMLNIDELIQTIKG